MRLIDADLLLKQRFKDGMIDGNELLVPYNDVVNAIRQAPTVDAVEVVRCKDCIYFKESKITNRAYCDWHREHFETYPNDYCCYGERRTPNEKDNV